MPGVIYCTAAESRRDDPLVERLCLERAWTCNTAWETLIGDPALVSELHHRDAFAFRQDEVAVIDTGCQAFTAGL